MRVSASIGRVVWTTVKLVNEITGREVGSTGKNTTKHVSVSLFTQV